jgi:N-dimethylarginine dimethylaminohydrolase
MRVKILKRGEKPIVIPDFDMLIVETEGGTPVAVACRYGPEGAYVVSSVDDDKRFNEVLQKLGLDRTVVVTDLSKLMKPDGSLPHLL